MDQKRSQILYNIVIITVPLIAKSLRVISQCLCSYPKINSFSNIRYHGKHAIFYITRGKTMPLHNILIFSTRNFISNRKKHFIFM